MSLVKVNNAVWDTVDSDGVHIEEGPQPKQAVAMPRRWRVFGPFDPQMVDVHVEPDVANSAKPKAVAGKNQLAVIPDKLTVGDTTLPGTDVDMLENMLDFDAMYDGHDSREGYQAYALAELEVDRDTEFIIGAGADWWMQWWIDGEPVYDTLATGNGPYSLQTTDHCFRHTLAAGKHVLAVMVISGSGGPWAIRTDTVSARDEAYAKRAADKWSFLTDPDDVHPPPVGCELHKAFRTDLTLSDETVECEYQLPFDNGHMGVVFGAQNSDHYYWAYIPHWGQLWRARALYAAIAIAEGTGHIRHLDMRLMPNVPCHLNIWRSLRVQRRGNHIQMWVNGVKGPSAVDDTYGPGRVGVSGYNRGAIRNLKIEGEKVNGPAWAPSGPRKRNFYEPFRNDGPCHYQHPGGICKLANGELIIPVHINNSPNPYTPEPGHCHTRWYRSADAGRTWSQYAQPERRNLPMGNCFEVEPGVIRWLHYHHPPAGSTALQDIFTQGNGFYYRDSDDLCQTYNGWQLGAQVGDWSQLNRDGCHVNMGYLIRLRDGTLSLNLIRELPLIMNLRHKGQGTWPLNRGIHPYCVRSTDGGKTWSQPAPMDHAALYLGMAPDDHVSDFTETPMAELPSGRIIAMSRPFCSPYMWQTYSDDGGRNWRQACYAPFSASGGPNLVLTQSGYLALIARSSGMGVHISTDEGMNWTAGGMIDSPNYYNGSAIEVEPDVVLVSYPIIDVVPGYARMQRVRIMPDRTVPAD